MRNRRGKDSDEEPDTGRSGGGPGSSHQASSHQGGGHGHAPCEAWRTVPGAPTNSSESQVSGGGGGHDSHRKHVPKRKGDRFGR